MPIVVRASISSMAFMEAISAVIEAPTLPASMIPAMSGTSSFDHGDADEIGQVDVGPEHLELGGRSQRNGDADEEGDQADDGIGPVAHRVDLMKDLAGQNAAPAAQIFEGVIDLVSQQREESADIDQYPHFPSFSRPL